MGSGTLTRYCFGLIITVLTNEQKQAMILRRFDFDYDTSEAATSMDPRDDPQDLQHPVGMRTGATIHTRNGLNMIVKSRQWN